MKISLLLQQFKTSQPRVFAVQMFALHRLIKARLRKPAPNLLADDQLYVRKFPKTTFAMPLPSGRVIDAHPAVLLKRGTATTSQSKTIDCSCNNTAEKTCVRFDISAAGSGVASQNSD